MVEELVARDGKGMGKGRGGRGKGKGKGGGVLTYMHMHMCAVPQPCRTCRVLVPASCTART